MQAKVATRAVQLANEYTNSIRAKKLLTTIYTWAKLALVIKYIPQQPSLGLTMHSLKKKKLIKKHLCT